MVVVTKPKLSEADQHIINDIGRVLDNINHIDSDEIEFSTNASHPTQFTVLLRKVPKLRMVDLQNLQHACRDQYKNITLEFTNGTVRFRLYKNGHVPDIKKSRKRNSVPIYSRTTSWTIPIHAKKATETLKQVLNIVQQNCECQFDTDIETLEDGTVTLSCFVVDAMCYSMFDEIVSIPCVQKTEICFDKRCIVFEIDTDGPKSWQLTPGMAKKRKH